MTDNKKPVADTIGEKINQAREEERQRWLSSRPNIKLEIGFTPLPYAEPTFTLTIKGGQLDAVHALGHRLSAAALEALHSLNPEVAA